jgi:putative DNA primase/helicase
LVFATGYSIPKAGIFSPHHKSHWLRTLCDVDFTPPVEGETLETHAEFLALARPGGR